VHVLLAKPFIVSYARVSFARDDSALRVPPKLVHALVVHPLRPVRRIELQHGRRQDAVAGGVLDVDVEVAALHAHDHVEVDLQGPAYALLDGERVHLLAAPPTREL
jgi:hypothetical protein